MLAFVADLAGTNGVGPEKGSRLELAVEEWVVNLCRHAYGPQGGTVEVVVRADPAHFQVEIADDGPEFDLTARPDPDTSAPLEERTPGGLGLLLIRRMTDEVVYRREGDRNVVTLKVAIAQS